MVTLITGPTSGIGKDIATEFAKRGHNLILVARRENALIQLQSELQAQFSIQIEIYPLDLTNYKALQIAIQYFKTLEIQHLVNNAGIGVSGPFSETQWKQTQNMLQLNMLSLTQLSYALLPSIQKLKGGILNVASTAAFQAGPYMAAYFATKAYVHSLSQALHVELKNSGSWCTVVCPGPTKTEFANVAGVNHVSVFNSPLATSSAFVAKSAVKAFFSKRTRVIPGFFNKIGKCIVSLLPDAWAAKASASIFK